MTDDIGWCDVGSEDHNTLVTLLNSFDDIFDSSPQILLAIEVPDQFEDLGSEGVIGLGVGQR